MDTAGRSQPTPGDAGLSRPDADWVPLPEAARQLRLSERALRRRVASGHYNARKWGRVTLVAVSARDREDARIARERPPTTAEAAGDDREAPGTAESGRESHGNAPLAPDLAETVLRLARAVEANVEKDRLLAAMLERIGNLEARLREREALPPPRTPWWAIWRRR